jgi:hypothetical protein
MAPELLKKYEVEIRGTQKEEDLKKFEEKIKKESFKKSALKKTSNKH